MKKQIFETSEIKEPNPVLTETSSDVLFMAGALRAAKHSSPKIRQKILNDISAYSSIPANEVAFMFASDNDNNDHAVFDFPDSERRRLCIRNNMLDAAE